MMVLTMSNRLKVTSSGQVSVPASIRKRWEASYLTAEDHGDHLILRPAPDDPIEAVFGIFALEAQGKPDLQQIRAEERDADQIVEESEWPDR